MQPLMHLQFCAVCCSQEVCENLPAPPTTKPCDCAVLPCNPALASKCPSQATCSAPDDLDRYFVELGCFKRVDGHEGPGREGKTAIDWSCMDYDGKLPCKSGVPLLGHPTLRGSRPVEEN